MSWYMHFANNAVPDSRYLGFDYDIDIFSQVLEMKRKDLVKMYKKCNKEGLFTSVDIFSGEASVLEIQLALQIKFSDFETGLCPGTK